MLHQRELSGFLFSTDPGLIDFDAVHTFLTTSYWSPGISRALVERAIANSIPFGVYERSQPHPDPHRQVGFARIVTDRATFAYMADVFITQPFRRRGLSKLLMHFIFDHPDLQGRRRICLMTRDAQGLYERYGFTYLDDPRRFMELVNRNTASGTP